MNKKAFTEGQLKVLNKLSNVSKESLIQQAIAFEIEVSKPLEELTAEELRIEIVKTDLLEYVDGYLSLNIKTAKHFIPRAQREWAKEMQDKFDEQMMEGVDPKTLN